MRRPPFGIAVGGEQRLRKATEARIRAKYREELAAAKDRRQRSAVEEMIQEEFRQEMKRVTSPHSLWGSQ